LTCIVDLRGVALINIVVYNDKSDLDNVMECVQKAIETESYHAHIRGSCEPEKVIEDVEKNPLLCDIAIIDFGNFTIDDMKNSFWVAGELSDLNCNAQMIFISSAAMYITKLYDITHVYYLAKPLSSEMLGKAINKAVTNIKKNELYDSDRLFVSTRNRIILIKREQILFFRKRRRQLDVCTIERNTVDLTRYFPYWTTDLLGATTVS